MLLTTLHHEGKRASYQTLVQVRVRGTNAIVRDETGLWTATVEMSERLQTRMGNEEVAYFWARLRGGDIDLRDREIDPEWEGA